MAQGRAVTWVAVLGLAVLPLAGCVTSRTLSSKDLCEGSGGSYAEATKTCNPGSAKSAAALCGAHGGIYMASGDICHIPVK
jgi:hypothetical protein